MTKKTFQQDKDKEAEQSNQHSCEQGDGWVPEEMKQSVLDNYVEIVKLRIGR